MAKTVYVGMSGGVDSSVVAALLKDQGYRTVGVYMKNWTKNLPGFTCPWKEDYMDAKRVATQLGIEFKVFDFENNYRQKVVDYMVREYQAGRTPNPDIMCNQEIKFKLFLDTALDDGADLIATGHYAITDGDKLYAGLDTNKDQSYFLYRITAEAVSRSLMPLGRKTKPEVRKLAQDLGLYTAAKKDSQGICFVGEVGIKDFLLNELGPQPSGKIVDQTGKQVGEHEGAIFYTIGQRHGLNVGGGLPYYVTGKDMQKNIVYVTTDLNDSNLWSDKVKLNQLHWINQPVKENRVIEARLRYRGPLVPAKLRDHTLSLDEPVRGVAAGQSAVLYDRGQVLGGGIIS